ncbi:MAG: hypothetical protein Q6356_004350 [Candidatus Wukongarchaeota archaeon]|nr:hypothetical protein [Candidatus Wukongarchaeota archaeon]
MGLVGLYVFKQNGVELFHRHFEEITADSIILTGFFSAIQSFANTIIDKGIPGKTKIKGMDLEGYFFGFGLIDELEITIVVVVTKDYQEMVQGLISRITGLIGSHFGGKPLQWEGESDSLKILENSIDRLVEEFVEEREKGGETRVLVEKKEHTIPVLVNDYSSVKLSKDEHRILDLVDGKRSITEISEELGKPWFDIMQKCLALKKRSLISLEKKFV